MGKIVLQIFYCYLFIQNKAPRHLQAAGKHERMEILEKLEWTSFFLMYLNNYQKTDIEERHIVPLIN